MNTNHQMRSVEIFAGAAGLGLGLAQAGFKHEVVVERDQSACETIRLNQRNNHPLVAGWDIREASIEDCDLSDVQAEPDLLAGGPPCQSFSIGGQHKGHRDDRNLWPWAIRTVADLRPKAFLFENVPNLATGHRDYMAYLVRALELPTIAEPDNWAEDSDRLARIIATGQSFDPSYKVSVNTLLAADFGTGQKRKRLFIVGVRKDLEGEFVTPEPTHSAEQLLEDKWLSGVYWDRHDLPRPMLDEAGARWLRKHNRAPRDLFAPRLAAHRTVRDIFSAIPEDAPNHEDAPREAKVYKGHTGSPIDDPSKTLRAGDHGVSGGENLTDFGEGAPIRYKHFSVREAAALSDFPHDYRFDGTWSDGLKQIGNAVPCNLGRAVGASLANLLRAA